MSASFQEALGVLNYAKRCHALAALGRKLAVDQSGATLEAALDGLAAPGLPAAFVEKSRLLVAKAAGCLGYSRKYLDHPSQSVRFSAVRGGLLRPEDARSAFLSQDSGRKLKKLLVKCPQLPCDEETLREAEKLFGSQDKERLWEVLARVEDEALFKAWLPKLETWLAENDRDSKVPGLPRLAARFPDTFLEELVEKEQLVFKWYWVMPLLQICPEKVLRLTFLEHHTEGSGPLRNKLHYDDAAASWGWRHQPEVMLSICQELSEDSGDDSDSDSGHEKSHWSLVRLVEALMEISSTKQYITTSQKVGLLAQVFSRVPEKAKTAKLVLSFVRLLPDGLKAHRSKEIQTLVSAFWQLVSEVGRTVRRQVLVGPEEKPSLTDLLSCFLKKLPPPLAVEQFFKVLKEFEAGVATYRFVQSDVCKSETGEHDGLMGSVFERFLQQEKATACETAEMFQVLLTDAQTMDVVQSSFDLLVRRLGGHTENLLFQRVVLRMRSLEIASRGNSKTPPPKSSLPVPVAWVRFVELPFSAAPHVDLLLRLLHSGPGTAEPLGLLLAQYGPGFFWDALSHVLQSCLGSGPKLAQAVCAAPSMQCIEKLDIAGLARPLRAATAGQAAGVVDRASEYFERLAELKTKTYGRDDEARETGFGEMMRLAQQDPDPSKAFEDFLPFLVGRLNKEKEGVRVGAVDMLLLEKTLPVPLWAEKLQHLRALYKVCAKTRSPLNETWRSVGKQLVSLALHEWQSGQEAPTEACIFGMEVGRTCKEELDLPAIYKEVGKERAKDGKPEVPEPAARWVFETSVPLAGHSPQQVFWTVLGRMAEMAPAGAERQLWQQWPWVKARWCELLAQPAGQRGADFLMVGAVEQLLERQPKLRLPEDPADFAWWEPVACEEYEKAVAAVLQQMEASRIPARDAAAILVRRARALLRQKGLVKGPESTRAQDWLSEQKWDLQKHHKFVRMPCRPNRSPDEAARAELATLAKLLKSGEARRQVLWLVAELAAMLQGPLVQELLREAIAGLDPKHEGQARCIARSYPYFNTALTKGEEQQGCPDVLTPLVELWLADDKCRDGCVELLMQRPDCHYFLFFGTSFTKHLSIMRQEWLHRCLEQLHACGEGPPEFYHYNKRGPSIVRIAQQGVKRYRIPCPRLRTGGGKRSKRKQLQEKRKQCNAKACTSEPMQLFLWHPKTQAQFLEKALTSTKTLALAVIPRLEFADGIARVSELLDSYPKDSGSAGEDEGFSWEVLQTAGAYSSLSVEIERHFAEMPAPRVKDAVGDPEVQQLLVGLGRADDAAAALAVLGKYAGKVKQAKEAVVKMVATLSPQQARKVMTEVMLAPSAGVALQVAALRLMADLSIPEPLELYRVAWNEGECHRDIAANIMSKLATAPLAHWSPADVESFYGFFQLEARAEDHSYVAEQLLDHLKVTPKWTLPFLPRLVEKLVMMRGCTGSAAMALVKTTSFVTEVVGVLLRLRAAKGIAVRAKVLGSGGGSPQAEVMKELAALSQDFCQVSGCLEDCDPIVLWQFVLQELPESSLVSVLNVWNRLLRRGNIAEWPKLLQQMAQKLARGGQPSKLCSLATSVVQRMGALQAADGRGEAFDRDGAILAVRAFLEQLLDERLAVQEQPGKEEDAKCREKREAKAKVARDLVMVQWPSLLHRGCAEGELGRLYGRCPAGQRKELAKALVDQSLGGGKKKHSAAREAVACSAISWLAADSSLRNQHIASLLELWVKLVVVREESEDAFKAALPLLGEPLDAEERAVAVDRLADQKAGPAVLRAALSWLAEEEPQAAVQRWTALLGAVEEPTEDVKALVALCEAEGLKPPELPPVLARALPEEALQLFLKSSIPEARIVALQVLQARHVTPGQQEALEQLCGDGSAVVSAAAKLLRDSLAEPANAPAARFPTPKGFGRGGSRRGRGRGRMTALFSESEGGSEASDSDEEDGSDGSSSVCEWDKPASESW